MFVPLQRTGKILAHLSDFAVKRKSLVRWLVYIILALLYNTDDMKSTFLVSHTVQFYDEQRKTRKGHKYSFDQIKWPRPHYIGNPRM
jgi:hypothetical protein